MRRILPILLLLPFAAQAQYSQAQYSQAQYSQAQYTDPATGARPGNIPGTGQSLPLSDKASNATAADTRSVIAPRLPSPLAGDDSSPRGFLQAAERAITLGRTGEAQEALERAESRLLDRSVAPSRAGDPNRNPLVERTGAARRALAAGDRGRAQEMIQSVLAELR